MPASAEPPPLPDACVFYLEAFLELQHDRNEYGFIPFTSIDAFARRYRVRGGMYEKFRRVVRAVNVLVNEHIESKRQQARTHDERRRRIRDQGQE